MSLPEDISKLERHCPRLGHLLQFDYCRTAEGEGKPCFKSLECWWERFDVTGYLRHALPQTEFNRLTQSRPPEKMASLVDLIRQAKQRSGQ